MGRTRRYDKEWGPKLTKKKDKYKSQKTDSVDRFRTDPSLYEEDYEDDEEEEYIYKTRNKDPRGL